MKSHWPSRSPPLDLSDVPLAGEDTASKSLEVTLARKDNCPRAPDQAEDSSSPIVSSLRNKYFETSHCFGLSITPLLDHQKVIEQSARHRRRACGCSTFYYEAILLQLLLPRIANLLRIINYKEILQASLASQSAKTAEGPAVVLQLQSSIFATTLPRRL